jgi:hypothetical protein
MATANQLEKIRRNGKEKTIWQATKKSWNSSVAIFIWLLGTH